MQNKHLKWEDLPFQITQTAQKWVKGLTLGCTGWDDFKVFRHEKWVIHGVPSVWRNVIVHIFNSNDEISDLIGVWKLPTGGLDPEKIK